METSPESHESDNPTSPTSSSGSSIHNISTTAAPHHHTKPHTTYPLPQPPPPITRLESHPYPTTFVQADASSFKEVVRLLTGSSDTARQQASQTQPAVSRNPIPPIKAPTKPKPSSSRLYERRYNNTLGRIVSPVVPGFIKISISSPRNRQEILSPSMLDFPSLVLSPVTPLIPDPFRRSGTPNVLAVDKTAEEKAIAEKGFYLHPSPVTTPRDSEPRLLPLFPTTSPRVVGGSGYGV